eukprot:TRINITY_DN4485_c0_g1_i2.p1 TRINITY_DN4485_c0_g1~~TRINITY_DN4485_c0_g1_i2.p1  ORF type:complete len:342 (+),score=51.90 TRINITY_DN4485_c0_g1_i2:214-1239(+)
MDKKQDEPQTTAKQLEEVKKVQEDNSQQQIAQQNPKTDKPQKTECKYQQSCKKYPRCNFDHGKEQCKFGEKCDKIKDCKFNHDPAVVYQMRKNEEIKQQKEVEKQRENTNKICKAKENCKTMSTCKFIHPRTQKYQTLFFQEFNICPELDKCNDSNCKLIHPYTMEFCDRLAQIRQKNKDVKCNIGNGCCNFSCIYWHDDDKLICKHNSTCQFNQLYIIPGSFFCLSCIVKPENQKHFTKEQVEKYYITSFCDGPKECKCQKIHQNTDISYYYTINKYRICDMGPKCQDSSCKLLHEHKSNETEQYKKQLNYLELISKQTCDKTKQECEKTRTFCICAHKQ